MKPLMLTPQVIEISWKADYSVEQVGDQTVKVRGSSMWGQMKISNWAFGPGSIGYRLIFSLGVSAVDVSRFVISPGAIVDPPTPLTNFDSVTVVDQSKRQAAVSAL